MPTSVPYILYRVRLDDGNGGTRLTRAVWGNDLALDIQRESQQQFFRTKLQGKLVFVAADADWITARPYGTSFTTLIDRSFDGGLTWSVMWRGIFYHTDCEISLDDRRVTVTPAVDDEYTKVLAGLEKEFNLIDLLPQIERVAISKNPLVQIYYPGEDIVSCLFNGMAWEQDVSATDDDGILVDTYHFHRDTTWHRMVATKNGEFFDEYDAQYVGSDDFETNFYGSTPTYIHMNYWVDGTAQLPMYHFHVDMIRTTDGVTIYQTRMNQASPIDYNNFSFDMGATQYAEGTMHIELEQLFFYSRLLCDVETIEGTDTYQLETDDFCYDNRNYHRVAPLDLGNRVVLSNASSSQPTEWGRRADGRYWTEPSTGEDMYPIARSGWVNKSIWYADYFNFLAWLRSVAAKKVMLQTAYPLSSVIDVLLQKIDPSLTFLSVFFGQGTNPVDGETNAEILITPKSNILAGEFSEPAKKAPITLGKLMEMLASVFQCFWSVSNGHLRVEHIKFYRNGNSYSRTPQTWIDLTDLRDIRTDKPLSWGTNTYSYEKSKMSQTYQFAWMDEVTQPFKGEPINVVSPFVELGKVENVNAGDFTSDIDYALLNPQAISNDGFMILAATRTAQGLGLTDTVLVRNAYPWVKHKYVMQNGRLAYYYLQPHFWLYDMPARSLEVNGEAVTASGVKRTKKQEVNFPCYGDPSPYMLIGTGLGDGYVERISLSLSSGNAKTTLIYEPE